MPNKTYFDRNNSGFSLRAHMSAKRKIYPQIFPEGSIKSIRHENGSAADLREKIDVKVVVLQNGIEVCYTIQERWRRLDYAQKRDVTITAFNNESGIPAEFYRGEMHFVLYGYWDEKKDKFGEVIFCNFPSMRYKQLIGTLYPGTEINPKKQDFFTYHFSVLKNKDCVEWSNFELTKQRLPHLPSYDASSDVLELRKEILRLKNLHNSKIRKVLTPTEHAQMSAAAEQAGLSLSAWLVMAANKWLEIERANNEINRANDPDWWMKKLKVK